MHPLIDAHNHLQAPALAPHLGEIIQALEEQGIAASVVNGTTEDDWPAVADLARRLPWVRPSYGLHPWHVAARSPQWLEKLRAMLGCDPAAGVGEIGLDRWKEPFDFADQQAVFLQQLALAVELGRPVSIHVLRAWGAAAELLHSRPVPPGGFLLHAYGGPVELVRCFVEKGAYFSFSGSFFHERQAAKRAAFLAVPLTRLLVESDAPAMPLPPDRITHPLPPEPDGTPVNHPGNLRAVYEGLAALRSMPLDALAGQVAENFTRWWTGQNPV